MSSPSPRSTWQCPPRALTRALLAPLLAVMLIGGRVVAQNMRVPPVLDAAALVSDKLGQAAAFDVALVDEYGQPFVLAERMKGERPIVLNLGYFGCPGMCGFVLNTFLERMVESGMRPGHELDLLTVSVHPKESVELASDKKRSYLEAFKQPEWAVHWHFLTGAGDETRRLASSVGWGFRHDLETDEIDHPPVVVVLSPKGVVTRYLDARDFDSTTLRRAIIETSGGKIGSFLERIVVTCLTFDPNSGRYEVAAMTIMRIGGGVTVVAVATMIFLLWRRERRVRATAVAAPMSA